MVTTYSYNVAGELALTDYSDATPDVAVTYTSFGGRASVSNGVATTVFGHDPATLAPDTETVSYDFNGDTVADFTRVIDRSQDVHNRETGWELKDGSTVENEVEYSYDTAGRIDEVESPAGTFAYGYLPLPAS